MFWVWYNNFMKTKDNNIHAGHRERFRETVKRTGIYNLSDLHFLEYLLMFVIPRVDTNPIAHGLLKEFGAIDNIFDASEEALMLVPGVGRKTAEFLQAMSGVCFMNNKSRLGKKPRIQNLSSAVEYIQNVLPPSSNEQFIVIVCTKPFDVKYHKIFTGVSHSFVNFDSKELTQLLIKHKVEFCLFAHTHPDHSSAPSPSDKVTFEGLAPLLATLGIKLMDNLILGKDDFYSFNRNKLVKYTDITITPEMFEKFRVDDKDDKLKNKPTGNMV